MICLSGKNNRVMRRNPWCCICVVFNFIMLIGGMQAFALHMNAQVNGPLPGGMPGAAGYVVSQAPPSYRLGPGDTIFISILNMPELDSTAVVGPSGHLHLAYLKAAPRASGLTSLALGRVIVRALKSQQIVLDPQVMVSILRVHSRPVTVAGDVNKPVVLQADRPLSLLEAIIRAGGPSPGAGTLVLLTSGSGPNRVARELPLSRVLAGNDPAFNPMLHGEDFVQVLPGGQIFVAGDVHRPGAFPIRRGQRMNVAKAMALARSWKSGADPARAVIVRTLPNGSTRSIMVNLPRIMNRHARDVRLAANDILYVPANDLRTVGIYTVKGLASSAFLGLAYVLTKF